MKTILLVDDELALIDVLTDHLHDDGYRVVAARDGRQGLSQVARHSPHLIVSDLMMPAMDGFEMCKAIRLVARTPIILMSVLLEASVTSRFDGYCKFLQKPFRLTALSRAVSDALAGPAPT